MRDPSRTEGISDQNWAPPGKALCGDLDSRIPLSWPVFTQISGRNFLPELCGESILKLPVSKLCTVPVSLQKRACFEGRKGQKRCREKGRKRGRASKRAKKEKRTRENRSVSLLETILESGSPKLLESPQTSRIPNLPRSSLATCLNFSVHLRAIQRFGTPELGSVEGGHPDLFRFLRFLPICSDLRSLLSGIVPICSDLLRFLPICVHNKSGKRLSAADPAFANSREVPRKFPRLPRKFPRPPQRSTFYVWEAGHLWWLTKSSSDSPTPTHAHVKYACHMKDCKMTFWISPKAPRGISCASRWHMGKEGWVQQAGDRRLCKTSASKWIVMQIWRCWIDRLIDGRIDR